MPPSRRSGSELQPFCTVIQSRSEAGARYCFYRFAGLRLLEASLSGSSWSAGGSWQQRSLLLPRPATVQSKQVFSMIGTGGRTERNGRLCKRARLPAGVAPDVSISPFSVACLIHLITDLLPPSSLRTPATRSMLNSRSGDPCRPYPDNQPGSISIAHFPCFLYADSSNLH